MDFVWDNPGEPVPEETFTHSHLSWSSIVPYLLHPSIMIHGILPVQSTRLTVFFQVFFGLPLGLAPFYSAFRKKYLFFRTAGRSLTNINGNFRKIKVKECVDSTNMNISLLSKTSWRRWPVDIVELCWSADRVRRVILACLILPSSDSRSPVTSSTAQRTPASLRK